MSSRQALQEIEARLPHLGDAERRQLLSRLAGDVRTARRRDHERKLSEMAADPDVQRELRLIEEEFAECLTDGLEAT